MCGVLGGFSGASNTRSLRACIAVLKFCAALLLVQLLAIQIFFPEKLDYEKDVRNYRFTYYRNFNDLRGMFVWISRLNLALDPVSSMLIVTTQ